MFDDYSYKFKKEEVLVYLRKSRSDDVTMTVEEVLAKHETILNEWSVRYMGGTVPEVNIYREIASGETIKDRPEIQKLLKAIESPAISAVLVVEVQRLSRGDLEDCGRLIKLFWHTDTMIITPQKIYDLNNEFDRDMFERELKRGNEFLEYQKKIMNRGRLLSVSQGNYIGSIPPYGYEKTTIRDGKRKCPTLKIKEDEANIVRIIFDMYVNKNMGYKKIADYLDENGVTPPKGERWSPNAIKDILINIHYIGKVKWNRRKTEIHVEDSLFISSRPRHDDYLTYDGKHEPIIPEDLFNAAVEKRGRNPRAKTATQIRNPFAGLVYCQCGRAMTYRTYTKDGKNRSAPRLLCDNQTYCNTCSCTYPEFEILVCEVLKKSIEDFKIALAENNADECTMHRQLISSLKIKLEKVKAKELLQWEKYTAPDSFMPEHIFKKLNEQVTREKKELKNALANAYASAPTPEDYQEKIDRFSSALAALKDDNISCREKNILLKSCINRITYDREKFYMPDGRVHRRKGGRINLEFDLRI